MRYCTQICLILLSVLFNGYFIPLFSQGKDTITVPDVESASRLLNLSFTNTEIDSMLDGLREHRSYYDSIRKWKVDNSDLPALVFNPLPFGFIPSNQQSPVEFPVDTSLDLPNNMTDLAFYSIPQLAGLIKSRKISSVELTEFYIDRLKKYNDTLHCVINLTEELAYKQALKADNELSDGHYRGILHGIPYGAKDLFAVPGYPTTWGAEPFRGQILDEEATVIRKLREAGAVLVAKLTMGALAWGDVWYGERTRNPWDPERGSSGSSAGSASTVSAGLLPFAIGTETLGSIISPSTVCGVTGLRPTYGRISRFGAMTLSWSMDKIGPICRTVEDCAVVFEAIRGKDNKDLSTRIADFNYSSELNVKKLRIGYLKSVFDIDSKKRLSVF